MSAEITIEEFNEIRKIPMVFIMGKERSGTTLLQTFLDSHPSIVAPPECEFIMLLYPKFGKIKKWSEKDILSFIEELYKEPLIPKVWNVDRAWLTSTFLSVREKADYASLCKVIYYFMRGEKKHILWIADKNPVYVLFIKPILKIFPEAKFIHLVREPKDNVNSHLKSFGGKNVRFISQKWLAYNAILCNLQKQMPEKYYRLLYENMVSEPGAAMQDLCRFLDVPYQENMVQNTFKSRFEALGASPEFKEKLKKIHVNLLEPVNTSNIGKWRTMAPEDIMTVEKITGKFATENFKYTLAGVQGSFPMPAKIRIFKTKLVYYAWQLFTRMKYRSYAFNIFYTNLNLYFGRETKVLEKTLRNE